MKLKSASLLLPLMLALLGAPVAAADDTLFQALGGQPGITRLNEDFVPRLKADAQIGHFFKETKNAHLIKQLSDQFCRVAGGGCELDGPNMKLAHESMEITAADFNRLVEVLQLSMEGQRIPFGVQNRLLARLAPMHRDIVNAPRSPE